MAADNDQFLKKAKKLAFDNMCSICEGNKPPELEEFFVVWFSKTLQNWKALVSCSDGEETYGYYWEITHDGNKHQTYVDRYKKESNRIIPDQATSKTLTLANGNEYNFTISDARQIGIIRRLSDFLSGHTASDFVPMFNVNGYMRGATLRSDLDASLYESDCEFLDDFWKWYFRNELNTTFLVESKSTDNFEVRSKTSLIQENITFGTMYWDLP